MTSRAAADVLTIERHYVEAFSAEARVPGVEVHIADDVAWMVHDGSAWRNSAIMVRMSTAAASRRLKRLVGRYERHGRGFGVWVSPLSTPADLRQRLTGHGLRCRKHFPAMLRDVAGTNPSLIAPAGLDIVPLRDVTPSQPNPVGRPTTARLRCELERLRVLLADPAGRTRVFMAVSDDEVFGSIELFVGRECSGIHGLSVLESHQGRGIGSALLERACHDASLAGSRRVALLATSEGQRLYERRGFREVARFDYWYRSFQR